MLTQIQFPKEETSLKNKHCPSLPLKLCQSMAECKIPCMGRYALDLAQPWQTQLIYCNVVIMAIIFPAVFWRIWQLPVLCDKLRCALQKGCTSLRRADKTGHGSTPMQTEFCQLRSHSSCHQQRDVCPMHHTDMPLGSSVQTNLQHQWLYRIWSTVLIS